MTVMSIWFWIETTGRLCTRSSTEIYIYIFQICWVQSAVTMTLRSTFMNCTQTPRLWYWCVRNLSVGWHIGIHATLARIEKSFHLELITEDDDLLSKYGGAKWRACLRSNEDCVFFAGACTGGSPWNQLNKRNGPVTAHEINMKVSLYTGNFGKYFQSVLSRSSTWMLWLCWSCQEGVINGTTNVWSSWSTEQSNTFMIMTVGPSHYSVCRQNIAGC